MSRLSPKDSDSSTSRPSADVLESVERDEWKRRSRNSSEKKRRDHFNTLISQLGTMLSSTPRKMDKSTVLKGTIAFFKDHNQSGDKVCAGVDTQHNWKPPFMADDEFVFLLLEALDGFLVVMCPGGKVLYVSAGVKSLLGTKQEDLVDTVMYDQVLPEDRSALYNFLQTTSEKPLDASSVVIHMKSLARGGKDTYELIRLRGYVKTSAQPESGEGSVVVAVGRVLEGPLLRPMSLLVDSASREFSSRHSLDWKFLFLDHHRAPPIIGYLPFEVLGTCAYDYFHPHDMKQLANDHLILMEKGEGTSGPYRFLTKGQQWIWLQSRYLITYHQWNAKPEFMVATHQLIGSEVGSVQREHCAQGMKRKVKMEESERGGGRERLLERQAELERRISAEQAQLRLVSLELLRNE